MEGDARAEVIRKCAEARKELLRYTQVEAPAVTTWTTIKIWLVYHLRPMLAMLPLCQACLSPFHAEMVRLGGPERISVMLIFARFDLDSSGDVDDLELAEYGRAGEALVANTSAQCSTLGVISALMLTATHMTTIGRPVPLATSSEFTQAHGQPASAVMLWIAYSLNATTEMLAAVLLIVTIYTRLLLANVLPSLGAKLDFLARSNINSNLVMGTTFMVVSLLLSIAASSLISSASVGYFGCGISLAAVPLLIRLITPHYFHGILRVRLEACQLLNYEKDVEAARRGSMGARSRVEPAEASPRRSAIEVQAHVAGAVARRRQGLVEEEQDAAV